MRQSKFLQLGITGTRLFLGLLFFTAGMAKLTQAFPGLMGPVWLEEKLEPYGLGDYARFIAWSQVVIGLLLLSQRFATLGAIMLLPMVLNILMITISMEWRGTPYVVSVFLVMNLALLIWDYPRLKALVSEDEEIPKRPLIRTSRKLDGLWLAAFVLILCSVPVISSGYLVGYFMVILGLGTFIFCQFALKTKL